MVKKINLLISLTLVFNVTLFGQLYNKQNTYIDALELKKIFEQNQVGINLENDKIYNDYYEIFLKYGIDKNNIDSNIFLKKYALKKNERVAANNGSLKSTTLSYTKPDIEAASASSMNLQASAINGLANFMAGRFKQEVLQVAIDQIFKQIKTEEDSALVKSIFPKTFKQIGNLYGAGSSSYYTADLLLLRQTAQIDIERLPYNLIKNSETVFPSLTNKPKIKDMLFLGNYIVEYSQQGQPLDRLLSTLASETYSSDSTIYKILNVADLISQALLDEEKSKDILVNTLNVLPATANLDKEKSKGIWVNPLNTLPATSISLKNLEIRFFYGLLYQQLTQIPEFKNYLESQDTNNLLAIASKIQDLTRFVNKLNNTYNYIKAKEFNLESPEEIITYVNDINQSLNLFTSTLKRIPEINSHYILNDSILEITGKYISIVDVLIQKDYKRVIPLLTIEFGEYMIKSGKSYRTIAFVSQLATIESADDMEALLSSYALPIGSSSIKRHSSFNISVNGYVGLTGGWETAYGSLKNQTKGNVGLSAPIGISTTFKGYLTPFISILDLGSVVNQRLNNDTTSYSNLTFEHFFTPGLGLFVNFRKLPISAGFHFNYIPNLRTIKYESGNAIITETNRSVTRINFSLLVDIPLYTLYNKEKVK